MTKGIDPEIFIRTHFDPFDFMLRVKVGGDSKLMLGNRQIQRTSRYYVAIKGDELCKVSPPVAGAKVGEFKRASKISEATWIDVNRQILPGTWDARIHTKNKSTHKLRETSFEAGWKVCEGNNAADFRFDNIDYRYYVSMKRGN